MKANWRNRSTSAWRKTIWAILAAGVVLATLLLQLVPHFAMPAPILTLVACLALGSASSRRIWMESQAVDLVPSGVGLEVRADGKRLCELRGKLLHGVSLCAGEEGRVDVVLTHGDRAHRSFVFEGLALEDVASFREALAIPHGGFGVLLFPQGPRSGAPSSFAILASLFMAGCNGFFAMTGVALETPLTFVLMALGCAVGFGAFAPFATRGSLAPYCGLSASGVRYFAGRPYDVPWERIASARVAGERVEVGLRSGHVLPIPLGALLPAEREQLVRQIASAVERVQRGDLPSSAYDTLARLERQPEETLRAWLSRVDALAVTPSGECGYRQTGVSEHELWDALAHPDTPNDVRLAVARRLGRSSVPAAKRVRAMSERLHTDNDRLRMRIAVATDLAQVPDHTGDLLQLAYR